jgi:CheY-like chemotaxis protein
VILSDIGLPDEDGLLHDPQAAKAPAALGRIPAAAVTAFTLSDDGEEPIRGRLPRHFRKPVGDADAVRCIAELAALGTSSGVRASGTRRRRSSQPRT